MNDKAIQKAAEYIYSRSAHGATADNGRYCTLCLMEEDGYPTASAITVSKNDGIKTLTFDTGLASNKAKRIEKCGKAAVNFCDDSVNITLVGDIEIVTDPAVKEEMWYPGMSHHFAGPDDPGYCVLRFTAKRYSILIMGEEFIEVEGTI
ncbi:MAG: pyridoxamine 5'-phosphate oxidase family protein [Oscillospiraceae bacterium]